CQSSQRVELAETECAVSYGRIFVNLFEARKKPKLSSLERAADRADSVLARERLFWIRLRIVEHIACIEGARAQVVTKVSVPLIRAAARADDYRTAVRA